jgi:hypothetical protein
LLAITAVGAAVPLFLIAKMVLLGWPQDFSIFWVAGRMALSGNASEAYYTAGLNFPYPPIALFFFVPFAFLPLILAPIVWTVLTAALFLWAAGPYVPRRFPAVLALLTPAALFNIFHGQTGFLFAALWLFAFSGAWPAVALLAFKPHLGFLSVLTLRGLRRFVLAATVLLIAVAVSMLWFGPDTWCGFLSRGFAHASELQLIGPAHRARWHFEAVSPAIAYGLAVWLPFAVAASALLARNFNAFTAATACVLISPYSFSYDLVAACLGFALLIFSGEFSIWRRLTLILGFLSPVITWVAGDYLVPPILLVALWVQTATPKPQDGTGRASNSDSVFVAKA